MADTINTYQTPEPESQEYVDQMVAKAEGAANTAPSDRPEWLPEKFKSPEDMAKAYSALEKKLGSKAPEQEAEQQPDETPADEEIPTDQNEVEDELQKRGLDFEELSSEFWEEGSLTEDSYKKLENAGIPRAVVDQFIAGQMAVMDGIRNQAFGLVGGEAEYNSMLEWAQANLSQKEQDAFNASVGTNDPERAMFAIKGLAARYRQEYGTEPKLVEGQNAPVSAGGFQSLAEVTAAMKDPRYGKDSAYRAEVARKLAKSSVL